MTTIAWDGKTLAGDKQTSFGSTPLVSKKVHVATHLDGHHVLFGCSGLADEAYAFRRWAFGEIEKPAFKDIGVICVERSGRIWVASETMHWLPISATQWAIGSGTDYALGAMAAGATALEAVLIASSLDIYSGCGVDEVRFPV